MKDHTGATKDRALVLARDTSGVWTIRCGCELLFSLNHNDLTRKLAKSSKERLQCGICFRENQAKNGAMSATFYTPVANRKPTLRERAEKAEALVRMLTIMCATVSDMENMEPSDREAIEAIIKMPGLRDDS